MKNKYLIPNGMLTLTPHNYVLQVYKIGQGLEKTDKVLELNLVRGGTGTSTPIKQEGVLSEQLLKAVQNYLTEVNVGDLKNKNTTFAITHIKQALKALDRRKEDRDKRGVSQTYKE